MVSSMYSFAKKPTKNPEGVVDTHSYDLGSGNYGRDGNGIIILRLNHKNRTIFFRLDAEFGKNFMPYLPYISTTRPYV